MAQIPLKEYLEEIDTLIDESRLGEAVAHCRHILEHYPRYVGAYRLLGKALLEQDAHTDAADVFRRVLSADPEDFLAHAGLAVVYKQEESFAETLWHMERAFEQDPYNVAIQEEMKELYGRRDGLAPERVPLTRGALARLYVTGELYQQAISELHDLLAANPDRLDLQVLLAEALWRDGRRVDAVERCQQILLRLPLCIKANAILAEVWLLTGREDEAQKFLQRLRELTQLSQNQLQGDSPAVRAFRAEGAEELPKRVLIERLPEEMAFASLTPDEGTGWVQDIDFEGDEVLDEDFDWLEALESDQDQAEVESAVASPDDEEEVMDWLRVVAAQGEEKEEAVGDSEGQQQSERESDEAVSPDESELEEVSEDAVTDDLPDWFQEAGEDEVDLGDTTDWFSEPVAGEAAFDEEMEWEAWMASDPNETPVDADETDLLDEVAGASGGEASETDLELGADSLPDWLEDEAEAAVAAGETSAQPEEAPDEQLQVEEAAMGTTDDYGNELEDLPDEDAPRTDQPEAEETPRDEDLDWLDELKEAGEARTAEGSGDESIAAGTDELPDWLRDDIDEAPDAGSLHDDAEMLPAGDLPDWLRDEDDEIAPAAAQDQDDVLADDDLSWLDQIAAGAGEPIEEPPTLEWPESDVPGDASGEAPEDLGEAKDWLEQVATEGEATGEADVAAEMEAETGLDWLDDLDMAEGGEEEEWLETSSEDTVPQDVETEEAKGASSAKTPDAGTEDQQVAEQSEKATSAELAEETGLDWLDELDEDTAADVDLDEEWLEDLPEDEDLVDAEELDSLLGTAEAEGAEEEVEEKPVAGAPEQAAAPEQLRAEAPEDEGSDELGWLDELAAGEVELEEDWPEDEDRVGEEEDESALDVPDGESLAASEEAAEGQREDLSDAPEDLDEAMAWLERLAAQQGASLDELPSLQEDAPSAGKELPESEDVPDWLEEMDVEGAVTEPEAEPEDEAEPPSEIDTGEEVDVPDAEEDLEWLDELVAGAEEATEEEIDWLAEEETADAEAAAEMEAAVDEDLSWLDDLDAEEAPAELASEPQTPEEVDEAMAWLEDMAAEESPTREEKAPGEAIPAGDAVAGLSDEIPDDPDEALAWLEQLASAGAPEASETPVIDEQPTPATPEDVVAARAHPEAAAPEEETATVEEEDLEVAPLEAREAPEAEAPDAAWEEEEALSAEPVAEETVDVAEEGDEPALETPVPEDADIAEELELFAEDAELEIPEDPDEAMAWLERLAARQGASLDELPSVERAEEEVETPEWIARERAEIETDAIEEPVAPESMEAEEAVADEFGLEELAGEEEAVAPDDVVDEEIVAEEPPIEEVTAEKEPAEEPPPIEELMTDVVEEEPEPVPPAEPEAETSLTEDFGDDFLGDLSQEDFDDSLPDWIKVDESAGFGWDESESDVTGWLQAEEEATQHDMKIPEEVTDWELPEEVEPASDEPQLGPEEAPAPEPPPRAPALDLDPERLESARTALDAGDLEAAVSDYRALLDAGEGINALIAELESQIAARDSAPALRELLGDAYMRNGQLQKALDTYRRALEQL